MVFSIGSMFDLAPPAEERRYAGHSHPRATSLENDQGTNEWGSDAERYFQLARAAMATGTSIVEQPTMSGVRALVRRLYISLQILTHQPVPYGILPYAVGYGSIPAKCLLLHFHRSQRGH